MNGLGPQIFFLPPFFSLYNLGTPAAFFCFPFPTCHDNLRARRKKKKITGFPPLYSFFCISKEIFLFSFFPPAFLWCAPPNLKLISPYGFTCLAVCPNSLKLFSYHKIWRAGSSKRRGGSLPVSFLGFFVKNFFFFPKYFLLFLLLFYLVFYKRVPLPPFARRLFQVFWGNWCPIPKNKKRNIL